MTAITSELRQRKPTVEFRAFSASLNEQKIVAYVRLCVGWSSGR
jgi:hypothetical protein